MVPHKTKGPVINYRDGGGGGGYKTIGWGGTS